MKISGIYKIINRVNGKYYVGSTYRFLRIVVEHKFDLRHNKHCNNKLQHAWNKYGESMFEFVIVEHLPAERLILIEQQYLDIAAKSGILGNAEMSNAVAQTISSNLMVGTTVAEVQKMAKSGELQQRMYNSTKTDIGGSSRIAAIMKEVNRISNSTSKSDYYFQGLGDKDKHVSRSREEALKYALDKYDIEQKVQNMNETVSAEQSKGKSLNGIVASPILNYWNNKWSL